MNIKEIALSFSKLMCPKEWHVLAWLSLPHRRESLMSMGTSASLSRALQNWTTANACTMQTKTAMVVSFDVCD